MNTRPPLHSIHTRPLRRNDFEALENIALEGGFERHLNLTASESRRWVQERINRIVKKDKKKVQSLLSKDDQPMGWLGVSEIEERPGSLQISYRFIRKKVEVQERVDLINQWVLSLFSNSEVFRLEVHFAAEDQENRDILVRAGFRLEGTLRQAIDLDSGRIDLAIYSIIKTDILV